MIFAILFILAFLFGAACYYFTRKWMYSVLVPMALFLVNALADPVESDVLLFTLAFGLSIIFFAGLFGAYVVQIRSDDYENLELEQDSEPLKAKDSV